ncbi:SDR family oxidoreductase [Pseudonocardia sp. C8]|uniref:SDR family NAD(P)-dependent oxidoreductase n=1 Tax=Pseudonocardia sp. C8 TaxID=2762759 RepID=UPI0016427A76|nr:SDR family NAD(P)-dependent oxidoreductase [Pseudonocardia sp. C8]MBC3191854.1 SDR family oxidoreductase [Pseudonocardia sp. C8]
MPEEVTAVPAPDPPTPSPRTALVTGAGSGIGRAVARRLARDGLTVLVTDRSPQAARHVRDEIAADGGDASAHVCDVTDETDVRALAGSVADRAGRVDVLVNNAGLAERPSTFEDQRPEIWDRVLAVSLHGTRICSREFGTRFMLPTGRGRIVNITSVAGLVGVPRMHAYSAAKAAVAMFTRTLACDWARHGVTVNAVAPGYVDTPPVAALAATGDLDVARLRARVPVGRLGSGADIAHAAAFLAHPDSGYLTGVVLPVDGGWTAFGDAGDAHREPLDTHPEKP